MSNSTERTTHDRSLYDVADLTSHTIALPGGGLRTFTHGFVLCAERGRIVFYVSKLSDITDRRIDPTLLDRELTRAGLPASRTTPALFDWATAILEDNSCDHRGRALPWMFMLNRDGSIQECWSCRSKVWPALVASLQVADGVQ